MSTSLYEMLVFICSVYQGPWTGVRIFKVIHSSKELINCNVIEWQSYALDASFSGGKKGFRELIVYF